MPIAETTANGRVLTRPRENSEAEQPTAAITNAFRGARLARLARLRMPMAEPMPMAAWKIP